MRIEEKVKNGLKTENRKTKTDRSGTVAEIKKNSILIVDDEKANLVLMTRILGDKYDIMTAKNGASAVKKAMEFLPDLILLDIAMPGISGYDVLNALRRNVATRTIPIIVVTGLDSSEEEERALMRNAVDFIPKPINPNIVKLRVRTQIRIVNQIRTIEQMCMTDQLTGAPNRRSFDVRLNMEWRRAIREKTDLSLLMFDIDHFKLYNDTCGHQRGDLVLKTVSGCINDSLMRPGDFSARWSSDGFAILLAMTDLKGAFLVAERVRKNIAALAIPFEGQASAVITVSGGLTSMIPNYTRSIDSLLTMAGNALDRAKTTGRNKVCHQIEA